MPDPCTYDYCVIRVVPRVERGEFINAGVILSCHASGFLEARIELDRTRLAALAPRLDPAPIEAALAAIPLVCAGGPAAGPIGRLSARERFHWLAAPRSTSIQTSPVHTGRCQDLEATLEDLLEKMVRTPASSLGTPASDDRAPRPEAHRDGCDRLRRRAGPSRR